jgi:hypothetical protein
LVKQLRGKRTLADFGALIGAQKNTVWRWEAVRRSLMPPTPNDYRNSLNATR